MREGEKHGRPDGITVETRGEPLRRVNCAKRGRRREGVGEAVRQLVREWVGERASERGSVRVSEGVSE